MRQRLSQAEIEQRLKQLDGWSYDDGCIRRTFQFKDFVQAFGFMARGALCAEKLDHHPDWSNVYNRVDVKLSTHDAGGVTELDFALAQQLAELA